MSVSDDAARLFGDMPPSKAPRPRAPALQRRVTGRSDVTLWPLAGIGILLLALVATAPMKTDRQALFAVITTVAFLVASRFQGRLVTLCLVALSVAISMRYIVWRISDTLEFDSTLQLMAGAGLVLAEVYAVTVLWLGYLQTAWPLHRSVMPLPEDTAAWPVVDVYITTYNEPIGVVRGTLLAALALDWPQDKLRVWLLDDGRREPLRRFAGEIGCGYLSRPHNSFEKAGNLNNAMASTNAEFIAVFDCDHIPTRGFLQLTMGWFLAEPNFAVVQTPQHCYSPDPFQRNLAAGSRMPGEANLFNGLIQDGNDTWNAAFFCGSCAVLRRTALDQIGGFATETVTEDAHTTLKLHRLGWDSAYVRLPLAGGLATERLSDHVRQRVRWARGMLQILRIDNPAIGPGLTLGQRLCYLQACGHFLFALPRIAFLTAPLAYLLGGLNVIAASPLAIAAYALPHMFLAVATNSRLQGHWRHSFWSEVYETVLALALVRVTVGTLLRPRHGRFDVTPKGGRIAEGGFDLRAVYPNVILALLLMAGLVRGTVEMAVSIDHGVAFQALLMNSIWAGLSLLAVLGALSVGRETRQAGEHAPVRAAVPVSIRARDGSALAGTATELSQGGCFVALDATIAMPVESDVDVVLHLSQDDMTVPAHVLHRGPQGLRLRWEPRSLDEEARMIQAVFGRADAWLGWSSYPQDQPLLSGWRVLTSISGLFRRKGLAGGGVAVILLSLALPASAQTTSPPRPTPPGGSKNGLTVRAVPQPLGQPSTGLSTDGAPADVPAVPLPAAGSRRVVFNLRELGAQGPLALRGINESQGVDFGIRADEVVTAAQLSLSGAMSPALLPELSNVTVTLNDQLVGTVSADRSQSAFAVSMPVSPVFFLDNNRLNFHFTGRYTPECNDALSGLLWATIAESSTLILTLQRLPPQRDLARLPRPFFDPREKSALTLPVVLPTSPGNESLRAGAIVTSWFGSQAGFRGARFPARAELPPDGNAVLIVVGSDPHATPGLPPIAGPTLAVIAHPADPLSSILVVAGRTGAEVVAAANALALGSRGLGGDVASVQAPDVPERLPYDAPNWMPTERPVRLGELVDAADLQSSGYTGLLHVPFRTAPNFAPEYSRTFTLKLKYRAPPGPVIDVAPSRLDVGINGIYLDTFSLARSERSASWVTQLVGSAPAAEAVSEARVSIPVYDVFGANDLQFFFDARPLHRGDCAAIPSDLRMAIDPDSTIDLDHAIRFTKMPNLAHFVGAGLPFTRLADLSQTAVVLADRPTSEEVGTFFDLMGRLGSLTGYPASRLVVTRPDGAAAFADRDLLVIGTFGSLPGLGGLLAEAPLQVQANRLTLRLPGALESVRRMFSDSAEADRRRLAAVFSASLSGGTVALIGTQSSLSAGRSVVALVAAEPAGLAGSPETLRDTSQAPLIQGDLSLLSGGRVTSYRVGATYTVGHLPLYLWPGWILRDQPFGMAALTLFGCALLGVAMFLALQRRADRRGARPKPKP